jgi:putative peptidoglycan lipid II flippase
VVRKALRVIVGRISGLHKAALFLSVFALFSQILALIRDRLLAHNFGAGLNLDIYYAAFKVPDLIFVTVASLVSISALVPLFAKKETEGEKHLKEATDSIFTVFSFFIVLFCIIFWFLMPFIIRASFSEMPAFAIDKVIFLSRLLLLSPLFLGFSNFFGSIVQYEKRFILYSLSPLLYNFGIIIGIVYLTGKIGISAPVYGVVFGALLHLLLQAAFVMLSPMRPRITMKIKWDDVWETGKFSVPRTFALSVSSFVGFFFAVLASKMGEGSISVFNLSWNIQSAPVSLIGVSFSLAAFPALAVSAAKNEINEIIARLSEGLRQIIFWSLPFMALIIVLRAHIVRVILGSGSFGWSATRLTAASLGLFTLSAVFQSITLFLSRSHYALGKTKWPLLGNVFGGLVSVVTALIFFGTSKSGTGLQGIAGFLNISDLPVGILLLPLTFSIGSLVGTVILFFALGKVFVREVWLKTRSVIAHSAASFFGCGVGAYLGLWLLDGIFDLDTFWGVLGHGFFAGLLGIALGGLALYLVDSPELEVLLRKLKERQIK